MRKAVRKDWKGKVSPLLYLPAIVLAFTSRWIAVAVHALVAVIWVIPDRRIERVMTEREA